MLDFDRSKPVKVISVSVTEKEFAHLEKMSYLNDCSKSMYIRYLIDLDRQGYDRDLAKAKREKPHKYKPRKGKYTERREYTPNKQYRN